MMKDSTGELVQAGAFPWKTGKDGKLRVLLVTSRRRGRWIVPKGWPMAGLSLAEAARIEARQEAGAAGRISPVEMTRYRYMKLMRDGAERRCVVSVFPLEVTSLKDRWKEEGQRKRGWFTVTEAAEMLDDGDLAGFVGSMTGDPSQITAITLQGLAVQA